MTDDNIPPPVLFNPLKHHAGSLRRRLARAAEEGEAGLRWLADELVVVGADLMDLYTGPLAPGEVCSELLDGLRATDRLEEPAYREWVGAAGGYTLVDVSDGSRWVFRAADDPRYVHVHPGRHVPHTRRVRANTLKTAVLVLACAAVRGGDPTSRRLVNAVRVEFLGLSPVGRVAADAGLGDLVAEMRAVSAPRVALPATVPARPATDRSPSA